jgi:hypothetical protein
MSKLSIQLSSFDQTWVRPQRWQCIPMSRSVASSYSSGAMRGRGLLVHFGRNRSDTLDDPVARRG